MSLQPGLTREAVRDDPNFEVTETVLSVGVFFMVNVIVKTGSDSSSATINVPGGINSPTQFLLPFSLFTGTAEFNDIDLIRLKIEPSEPPSAPASIEIDIFRTAALAVPVQPTTWGAIKSLRRFR